MEVTSSSEASKTATPAPPKEASAKKEAPEVKTADEPAVKKDLSSTNTGNTESAAPKQEAAEVAKTEEPAEIDAAAASSESAQTPSVDKTV